MQRRQPLVYRCLYIILVGQHRGGRAFTHVFAFLAPRQGTTGGIHLLVSTTASMGLKSVLYGVKNCYAEKKRTYASVTHEGALFRASRGYRHKHMSEVKQRAIRLNVSRAVGGQGDYFRKASPVIQEQPALSAVGVSSGVKRGQEGVLFVYAAGTYAYR